MPTVLINVRIDSKTLAILKEIVSAKGEKHLSNVVREGLSEYISSYTGEPTLKGLQKRVNEIDIRLRRIEDSLASL
ncbi:MAG: hypothetical protein ACUVRA_08020 [Candidatus Bathyarchaeaceae archaeon]